MRYRGTVLLLLAVSGVMIMSACTKKYTCQCKVLYSGTPGLPDSSVREFEIYNTQSAATSMCKDESYESTDPATGIKVKETCVLY